MLCKTSGGLRRLAGFIAENGARIPNTLQSCPLLASNKSQPSRLEFYEADDARRFLTDQKNQRRRDSQQVEGRFIRAFNVPALCSAVRTGSGRTNGGKVIDFLTGFETYLFCICVPNEKAISMLIQSSHFGAQHVPDLRLGRYATDQCFG